MATAPHPSEPLEPQVIRGKVSAANSGQNGVQNEEKRQTQYYQHRDAGLYTKGFECLERTKRILAQYSLGSKQEGR